MIYIHIFLKFVHYSLIIGKIIYSLYKLRITLLLINYKLCFVGVNVIKLIIDKKLFYLNSK